MAGKGIKFVIEVILGRTLGPDAYGIYALGLSLLMIFRHFSSLGLKTGILRFGAGYFSKKEYSNFRGLLKWALLLVIAGGISIGLVLILSRGYLSNRIFDDERLSIVFCLVGIGLPAYGAMWVVTEAIRAQKKIGLYTGMVHTGQPLLFLFIMVLGLLYGLSAFFY